MTKRQMEEIVTKLDEAYGYLGEVSSIILNLPESDYKSVLNSYLQNVGIMSLYLGIWISDVYDKLPDNPTEILPENSKEESMDDIKFGKIMKNLMKEKKDNDKSQTGE